jgi:hypothetical protein
MKKKTLALILGIVALFIAALFLMSGCASNEVSPTAKTTTFNSIEGTWSFTSASVAGEFVIVKVNGSLSVNSGNFNVNQKQYNITKITPINGDDILMEGNSPNNLVLQHALIGEDYNTITCSSFEYDTDDTPTTSGKEYIVIKRK